MGNETQRLQEVVEKHKPLQRFCTYLKDSNGPRRLVKLMISGTYLKGQVSDFFLSRSYTQLRVLIFFDCKTLPEAVCIPASVEKLYLENSQLKLNFRACAPRLKELSIDRSPNCFLVDDRDFDNSCFALCTRLEYMRLDFVDDAVRALLGKRSSLTKLLVNGRLVVIVSFRISELLEHYSRSLFYLSGLTVVVKTIHGRGPEDCNDQDVKEMVRFFSQNPRIKQFRLSVEDSNLARNLQCARQMLQHNYFLENLQLDYDIGVKDDEIRKRLERNKYSRESAAETATLILAISKRTRELLPKDMFNELAKTYYYTQRDNPITWKQHGIVIGGRAKRISRTEGFRMFFFYLFLASITYMIHLEKHYPESNITVVLELWVLFQAVSMVYLSACRN